MSQDLICLYICLLSHSYEVTGCKKLSLGYVIDIQHKWYKQVHKTNAVLVWNENYEQRN